MDSHLRPSSSSSTCVSSWSCEDVARWLEDNGLGEHQAIFRENLIDGETLLSLSERMIDKLLPLIKTQVQFTKLLDKLKGKSHTVTVSSPQERPHFELNLNNSVYSFQLPAFPPLLRKKLSEESPDFHTPAYRSKWRSQIIQVLFDSICLYTWYPSSKQYNGICGALVTKYPFLRDRTGQGYDSWLGMLKNKFKKERIPLNNPDIEYYRAKHGGKNFKQYRQVRLLQAKWQTRRLLSRM
ncbi:hypothetical protein AALO_G00285690 [Alosa alosa]|uniref:SAM domain-containing protein n=1 Tax=Alosa alosa TaxID=278164 RepID=A0AAV6FJY7_9TELE|nr:hypothetical protein AALO_G00285690 [Alosa alosa]